MFRLLGFLIGSAISIAIILLVTGIPDFHMENPEIDQKRFDEAVEKLMARRVDADVGPDSAKQDDTINGNVERSVSNNDNVTASMLPKAVSTTSNLQVEQPMVGPHTASHQSDRIITELASPKHGNPTESHWYSFWNPFRSEIAANGFVSQLEKVTGLDYRVVKVKAGSYEVAFAYVNDEERRRKLLQITTATGLDLPGL